MLLELSFACDTETKVIGRFDPDTDKFRVLGMDAPWPSGRRGQIVQAFYKHANPVVLRHTQDFNDFRVQLRHAFNSTIRDGRVQPWLDEWLQQINPDVEDLRSGKPTIHVGTGIQFYRDDGPRNSWVWYDHVKSMAVMLKSVPVRVEH